MGSAAQSAEVEGAGGDRDRQDRRADQEAAGEGRAARPEDHPVERSARDGPVGRRDREAGERGEDRWWRARDRAAAPASRTRPSRATSPAHGGSRRRHRRRRRPRWPSRREAPSNRWRRCETGPRRPDRRQDRDQRHAQRRPRCPPRRRAQITAATRKARFVTAFSGSRPETRAHALTIGVNWIENGLVHALFESRIPAHDARL
jgi:hypothetical protein